MKVFELLETDEWENVPPLVDPVQEFKFQQTRLFGLLQQLIIKLSHLGKDYPRQLDTISDSILYNDSVINGNITSNKDRLRHLHMLVSIIKDPVVHKQMISVVDKYERILKPAVQAFNQANNKKEKVWKEKRKARL